MTVTPHEDTRPAESDAGTYDVVIIGAGISGIGAAYRLTESDPSTRYVILEQRDRIGGTWDLFRYPGVRSDSSIFTLCWSWEPWSGDEYVADGDQIRDYMESAARKHGISPHIRFHTQVTSADWDSATDTWTVHVSENGERKTYRSRLVFFGSGYYNYAEPYTPEFPGMADFTGTVVHPQFWPDELDYTGKKMVVIGSGATAVSLVPALARKAAHVTMLQRSPGYMLSMPRVNPALSPIRKFLPRKASYSIIRSVALIFEKLMWVVARGAPGVAKKIIRAQNASMLPANYPVDVNFKPRYNPWDERMCLVADGDVFEAISKGTLEVVTDHVDHVDATGIVLKSGRHLDADIIVTATGLQLQALGGVRITVDGTEIKPQDRFSYKAHMLEDVPNLIWCIGYTNASWTLKADLTAEYVIRLLDEMERRGVRQCTPMAPAGEETPAPFLDFSSGYVTRAIDDFPRQGAVAPWRLYQNYFLDMWLTRWRRIDDQLAFTNPAP
jgi:cation diffusion facilitator CzcD-associated flavoprotein CzcO